MIAAVFEGNGRLELKERPQPKIKADTDVLLRITGVGICGTDLHILQVPPSHPAKLGSTLGHEFTGVVEDIGKEVDNLSVGDHVLVDPHPGCGTCEECKAGHPDRCIPLYSSAESGHCATIGIFSDGAMTSYVVVPAHALYRISSSVPAHIAALAEPLACVVSATRKLKVQPGDTAVVLGAGPIGLLYAAFFRACGAAKILISEISEYRRSVARDIGVDVVVDPNREDLAAIVRSEMPGGGAVVVEAVGHLLPQAIELIKAGGRLLQFGHDELARPEIPVAEIVRKEITIYGGFIGKFAFSQLPTIIESGVLPLDKLVSHQLPLSRVQEGLNLLRAGKAVKVVLHPEEH